MMCTKKILLGNCWSAEQAKIERRGGETEEERELEGRRQ